MIMRKFTKGLLMTIAASAISLGAFAQSEAFSGYFRVINAGYLNNGGKGVVTVSSPSTAQPTATMEEAIFDPGTVMYINAEQVGNRAETSAPYINISPNDLEVTLLRSQAVDAAQAVYGEVVNDVKELFATAITKFGLDEATQAQVLEDMFVNMKMYLEPNEDGTWYLKSSTPDLTPLANAIGMDPKEYTPDLMVAFIINKLRAEGQEEAAAQFEYFTARIHMSHTYYLIGGEVKTPITDKNLTEQAHDAGTEPFIGFANNTNYGAGSGLYPEIQVAGDYAKWILVPVDAQNPFKVEASLEGFQDKHHYTTGYFDFPFTYSGQTKAYKIVEQPVLGEFKTADDGSNPVAYVTLEECGGTVAAHTPVIIETALPTTAVLTPEGEPADEGDATIMKGIFFPQDFNDTGDLDADEFEYFAMPLGDSEFIARKLIRVFNTGKQSVNPLGFFKYNGTTIKANKGFIVLSEELANANVAIVDAQTYADGISEIATETKSNVVYDIQGRIVANPTKGLYIVNGKKVIK